MISLAGLGRPALFAALLFAVAGAGLFAHGAIRRNAGSTAAARRALTITALWVAAAAVALVTALFARDFSVSYVTAYSSRSLARGYTLAALWGGMEGSLLFWTMLLGGFAAIAMRKVTDAPHVLASWSGAVLAGLTVFFLALLLGPADPFVRMSPVPPDGSGLNPLLQSPGMMIHPPLLYVGFVGFSIPFAFGIAALLARRVEDDWYVRTRRWTLFAWSALSIGIVLGGAWAYTELGWGGYWAWDPVENASFMPWLTATAYLHSVVIQEKRRMFKAWNISLILLTYALALFGTFLTRSGLLSSIHTFTEGPIGKWFLPFLGLVLIGGIGLLLARLDDLRSNNRLDSLLSRESAFLLNNVLFVAAAITVLWGTLYPLIAELATGTRLAVGPPYFNSVFVPLGLALLVLTGVGPLMSWRRMNGRRLFRMMWIPLAAGTAVAVGLVVAGVHNLGAVLAFAICSGTLVSIGSEFVRGSRVHRRREQVGWATALGRTIARNRRRYGGYIVHVGIVLIVIGFAGNAFKVERRAELERGQPMTIGDYTLTYESLENIDTTEKEIFQVNLDARRDEDHVATLRPQRNIHLAQQQTQSEVAIHTTPVEDLYVIVTSLDPDGTAHVRAFVNPLTWWIWMGAGVMVGGMIVLLSGPGVVPVPAVRRSAVAEPAVAGT